MGFETPFFGAHAVARSTNYSDAQLFNLYPEISESKQGKRIGALFGLPGLTTVATVGSGPINGMHYFPGAGLLYVVSGTTLYSVNTSFVATSIGTIGGSGRVSMIDNGFDLGVFANGQGTRYRPSSSAFGAISMPFSATGTIIAAQQDGFGLINQPGSTQLFQSSTLDLSSWPGLNFGSATGDSDNLVGLVQTHREVFAVKQAETEIWVNAGTNPFAFQRLDGTYIEAGCIAPWSISKVGEGLMWLGQNDQGTGVVVEVNGYTPKRISTSAVENEIQGYTSLSDAIAYAYQFNGHQFYVLTFPTANVTWFYDKTTSDLLQTPMWGKWMTWNGSSFTRHLGNCFAFFNGTALVGDYTNGNIYKLDPSALTDGSNARKWLRTWRALPKASLDPVRFAGLTIDMETGGTGTTGTPTVSLRWSDDGGHTFSSALTANVGAFGATTQRVFFTRLGSTRRSTGLDRIFELSSTSVFPPRLIGAELT